MRPTATRTTSAVALAGLVLAGLATPAVPATAADPAAPPTDALAAHYDFADLSSSTVQDVSGNDRDATVVGAVVPGQRGLRLSSSAYVNLPPLLAGATSASVAVEVKADAAAFLANNFVWTFGGVGVSPSGGGTGYWFGAVHTTRARTKITPTNWQNEKDAHSSTTLAADTWYSMTSVLDADAQTLTLYVDGVQAAQATGVTVTPSQFGSHAVNYLGRSAYSDDVNFTGEVADLRVYTDALTPAEVDAIADEQAVEALAAQRAQVEAALGVEGATGRATRSVALPPGVTFTSSDTSVISNTGVVVRPAAGEPDAHVTLQVGYATRGLTESATYELTVPAQREDRLVAHYALDETSGFVAADASGNGADATVVGDATWLGGYGLRLNGTGYVSLPSNLLVGARSATVSIETSADPVSLGRNNFLWNIGGSGTQGYWFATTGNGHARTKITATTYTAEQSAEDPAAFPARTWTNITATIDGSVSPATITLYVDGEQVATTTNDLVVTPAQLATQTLNSIGRSAYGADSMYVGAVSQARIYAKALTPEQVADLYLENAPTVAGAFAVDVAAVAGTQVTTALPGAPGVTWTADVEGVVAPDGTITRPQSEQDQLVDVTATATYVDRTGAGTTLPAVSFQVPTRLPNDGPALVDADGGHFYADPNVAVFGDTYYIYATSDGKPGWGGNTFYSWSSKDLVTWTRAAEPFLTLDGNNGNVPWATGNAWAPTIIERDGKYYFYFSGHHPGDNAKNIGVAVADSPEGPFTAMSDSMLKGSTGNGQEIDPAAFRDPRTGKYYLFWGNGTPYYAELNDSMTSLKTSPMSIGGLTNFREGLFMNYREGTYHLTYSIDDTGSENYRVGYATATSITGPYIYRGEILVKDPALDVYATGHSSILNVPGTDDWYIVYHRFAQSVPAGQRTGYYRETKIDKITIGANGLFQRIQPTLKHVTPQTVMTPTLTGTARVGSTLTAAPTGPEWTATGFRWFVDGELVAGQTGSTYVVRAADAGRTVTAEITATDAYGHVSVRTTSGVAVALRSDATLASITVDGTPLPGFTPGVRQYAVQTATGTAVVAAVASDPAATVVVAPRASDGSYVITVTAQDGTTTATYRVVVTKKVVLATSSTSVTVSSSVQYGAAHTVKVKVSAGTTKVTGTATVTLRTGTKVVRTLKATLSSGAATVTLPRLSVGTYSVTAAYSGSSTVKSSSTTRTTKVTKVRSSITTTLGKSSIKAKTGSTLLKVKVRTTTGVVPTGKAKIQLVQGGKVRRTIYAPLSGGAASVTVKSLGIKGTYTVKVTYAGTTNIGSSSAARTLRVV
ncbi:family 43 glycosylhydrolase [Cellulomonas persica]|uniref:LamG-like jellyroll fold domain-containing protein n=1 Tax=Cellulomonas persica TaxID=76861 RepID=A0A510UVJ5_9CELL|nr:family 43 glycosylhydrolase [Cellulomonas persica]GEK18704.1 hypothetical protein CPE01_24370 [Cellulomonas persica]